MFKRILKNNQCCYFKIVLLAITLSQLVIIPAYSQVEVGGLSKTTINRLDEDDSSTIFIKDGIVSGNNLFHEFNSFNVGGDEVVKFEHRNNIRNVFSIIKDRQASIIRGGIFSDSLSNFIFLNENGFIFNDANISINGSFLATTASNIQFSDGSFLLSGDTIFPSHNLIEGLVFTGLSAPIEVLGRGHQLQQMPTPDRQAPVTGVGNLMNSFNIGGSSSISLIADGIVFDGGNLVSSGTDIQLVSISSGIIPVRSSSDLLFDYSLNDSKYSDIRLDNLSLIDTSGPSSGNVYLSGKNLNIREASFIFSQNNSSDKSGSIIAYFDEDINIFGALQNHNLTSLPVPIRSNAGIVSESLLGKGADINIKAKNLNLIDAGSIISSSNGNSIGGNINIDVDQDINIVGESKFDPVVLFSSIFAVNRDNSLGANIVIDAKNINLSRHAGIGAINQSSKDSGTIDIDVRGNVILGEFSSLSRFGNTIGSVSFASGNAADIHVKASKLELTNGSTLSSFTVSEGNGGDIFLDISGRLLVDGSFTNSDQQVSESQISASGILLPSVLTDQFVVGRLLLGDSGNISIKAGDLVLSNMGFISTSNLGNGFTGNIDVLGNNISLYNSSLRSISLIQGSGGNISLTNQNNLFLLNNSSITSESFGSGAGGNITISSANFVLGGMSDVVANSLSANGGNIFIDTIGFFVSTDSIITSSSGLGSSFDGVIDVNSPSIGISRVNKLDLDISAFREVDNICRKIDDSGSELTISGAEVLNLKPDFIDGYLEWHKQDKEPNSSLKYIHPVTKEIRTIKRIVGWIDHGDGTISLTSDPVQTVQYKSQNLPCQPQQDISS